MDPDKEISATREGLKKDLEDYIDVRLDVIKLKVIEKAGTTASGAVTAVSASFLGYFFILFLSVAAALALGDLFDNYALGFLCIAGFYGLVAALVVIFREKLITFPIVNALLKKFYYPAKHTEPGPSATE